MENRDKIFDQFKNAAENVAPKEFASMDNVWSRVEEKLDNKVLKNETKIWKKIAVAASILLFVSVGYHFFKNNNEIVIPENKVVAIDKNNDVLENDTNEKRIEKYPNITQEAKQKLEKIIKINNGLTYNDTPINADSSPSAVMVDPVVTVASAPIKSESEKEISEEYLKQDETNGILKTKIYDARSVKYSEVVDAKNEAKESTFIKKNPLIVIDGEAVTDNKNVAKQANLNSIEIDNIEILKQPLYIINGVQYSEDELFGEKPTSPYAPLEKQDIIKTKVYQGEEAVELYGEKGKKGVVVITTKFGKPVKN